MAFSRHVAASGSTSQGRLAAPAVAAGSGTLLGLAADGGYDRGYREQEVVLYIGARPAFSASFIVRFCHDASIAFSYVCNASVDEGSYPVWKSVL